MSRSAVVWIALLAVVAGLGVAAPARAAGLFIEAELGGRWISADWSGVRDFEPSGMLQPEGDILGPGITLGGTIGYKVTPMFAFVAHGDLGIHGAPDHPSFTIVGEPVTPDPDFRDIVDSGASLALLLGGRLYPMGADEKAPLQPYVGAGVGLESMVWSYTSAWQDAFRLVDRDQETDGVAALVLALEAGGDLKVSDRLSVGVGVRYLVNQWTEESVEGLDTSGLKGNTLDLTGHLGFSF
jgi:opacity protein-like surface antigen